MPNMKIIAKETSYLDFDDDNGKEIKNKLMFIIT